MAKLPGILELGNAPQGAREGTRPTGSIDVSGYERGAQAIAAGGKVLGQGVAALGQDIAADVQRRNDAKTVLAHAGVITDLKNHYSSLENSRDYANLPQQFDEGAKEIVSKWAETVPEGGYRQHFVASANQLVAQSAASIKNVAFNGLRQNNEETLKADRLDVQKSIVQDPDNPLNAAAQYAHAYKIDNAVTLGFKTPEQANLEKKQAAVEFQTGQAGVDATRTPLKFLRESGRLPRGEEALPSYWNKDAAQRASGVNPDLMAVVKRASEIAGVQFTIGHLGGTRDQATQDQLVAQGRSQTRNSNHLAGNAIDLIPIVDGKPNPDAKPEHYAEVSRAMKQAAGELGVDVGWGGDWKNFKDDAHFELPRGSQPTGNKYALVDPITLYRYQNHSETLLRERRVDEMRIATQASTQRAQQIGLTIDDAANGRAPLPPLEMIRNDPLIKGTNQELELTRRWDVAEKQGEQRRREDPAGVVDADPSVQTARASYDQTSPDTFQPVAQARLRAQEAMGIDPEYRSPITKDEALKLTAPLRTMLPGQEREVLTKLGGRFQSMFGESAPQALAYAIRAHKVDAETAQVAARVMRKLSLGQMVVPDEAHSVDAARETAAADRAITATDYTGREPIAIPFVGGYLNPAHEAEGPEVAKVPPRAIEYLLAHPESAADFDKQFAQAGLAKRLLEKYGAATGGP